MVKRRFRFVQNKRERERKKKRDTTPIISFISIHWNCIICAPFSSMIIFIAQLQPILFTDHNFRPLSIYYLNSITTIGVRACDIVVTFGRFFSIKFSSFTMTNEELNINVLSALNFYSHNFVRGVYLPKIKWYCMRFH